MESTGSRIAIVCILGLGVLVWLGASPRGDAGSGGRAFFHGAGQEVVAGSYGCFGSVYTDEQPADVGVFAWLSATSGITSDFSPPSGGQGEAPADLDALMEICESHIGEAVSQVPSICTLGQVVRERGEFGNGESVGVSFEFSCQGRRNEVIGVIGAFSRMPLALP